MLTSQKEKKSVIIAMNILQQMLKYKSTNNVGREVNIVGTQPGESWRDKTLNFKLKIKRKSSTSGQKWAQHGVQYDLK